ncbi:MAG: hypothetical protein LBQ14_09525 [Treponema sp.]|jgi:hypothetical protein|nr:hypothetical protein [Treponema sp.]
MKRYIGVVFLVLTAGMNVRAQVSAGAMLDMAFVPYQYVLREGAEEAEEDSVMGAGMGRYGSGQGIRARLDIRAAKDGLFGMRFRIQARADGIGIEDYLQAWWTPLSWLRFDAGRFLDDRLRGKISDDEKWNAYTVRMYDGDAIFSRFKTHWTGQAGFMASAEPVKNIYLGALLYGLSPFTASNSSTAASALFDAHPDYVTQNEDAWLNIQAAAAYTFEEWGLLRVQYFGAKPGVSFNRVTDELIDDSNNLIASYDFYTFSITAPRIEAAFAFTGLDNLTLDAGVKIPLPFKDWTLIRSDIFTKEDEDDWAPVYKTYKTGFIWQAPYQISAGFRWTLAALTLAGRIDSKFGGSVKGTVQEFHFGPEVNVSLWPSWNLGFMTLGLNFGFEYLWPAVDKNNSPIGKGTPRAMEGGSRIGFGASVQKELFRNCIVRGGAAYKPGGKVNGREEAGVLTIPVYLEFSL